MPIERHKIIIVGSRAIIEIKLLHLKKILKKLKMCLNINCFLHLKCSLRNISLQKRLHSKFSFATYSTPDGLLMRSKKDLNSVLSALIKVGNIDHILIYIIIPS